MNSSLILSVARCDLQRVMDLLCEGAEPDLVTREGSPLLHLALSHEDPEAALAMTQLLLVHGARIEARHTETGLTALEAAERLGREEIVSLLRSYGVKDTSQGIMSEGSRDQTETTFQKYIFDENKTQVRGNKFLEEVANLFDDNIRGAKDTLPREKVPNSNNADVTLAKSSSQPKSFLCPSNTNLTRSRMMCSTPTRSRDKSPSLEISQVSSIYQLGPQGDQSVVNTSQSVMGRSDISEELFQSCVSHANRDHTLSFTQQYLIEDKCEGVQLTEQRHSSVLALAGRNSSVIDDTSKTLLASPSLNTTYTVTCHKEDAELFCRFHGLMARSLSNIASITRSWAELCRIEMEMCDKFTNISNSAADLVNQLTRETACKASFNYLLLDPAISANLPMRVFQDSDQKLWRTFVNSVFYVGKGSRSRPFQHLYEAIKTFRKTSNIKKLSDKIKRIHRIWDSGGGVVVVQMFQNTIAVEAFTREALMIQALGCDNLTNLKAGDFYGTASGWEEDKRTELGIFLVFKAFKIFLQEGERQIRPADLKS